MMKACSINGCGKKHQARGLCMNHYVQARNKGEFNAYRVCKIDDCERMRFGKKYCEKHHKQITKYGRLLTSIDKTEQGKKARSRSSGSKGKTWTLAEDKKHFGIIPRSAFKKGNKPWCAGLKDWMTPEHKEKIRQANTGRTAWNKGLSGVMPVPHNKIGDGITPASRLERTKFRKTMQSAVFKRDNYTCQMCDEYGGDLQVDHIKSWAKHPELRFEMDNCRTLCMACHYYITFKRKMPKGIVWGHNLKRRMTS